MNSETQNVQKSRFIPVAIGIAIPTLFFIFRLTAAAAVLVFVLLCICVRWHHSRRAIHVAYALFVAAILIPVDVYVPGLNGPLYSSKRSGLRFVYVVHGKPHLQRCRELYGEFIADGCMVGLHDTRWRLVWD
jgi:hypothetical protein